MSRNWIRNYSEAVAEMGDMKTIDGSRVANQKLTLKVQSIGKVKSDSNETLSNSILNELTSMLSKSMKYLWNMKLLIESL